MDQEMVYEGAMVFVVYLNSEPDVDDDLGDSFLNSYESLLNKICYMVNFFLVRNSIYRIHDDRDVNFVHCSKKNVKNLRIILCFSIKVNGYYIIRSKDIVKRVDNCIVHVLLTIYKSFQDLIMYKQS